MADWMRDGGSRFYYRGMRAGTNTVRGAAHALLLQAARGFGYAARTLRYAAAGLLDRRELMEAALDGWRLPSDPAFIALGWLPWERELYEPYAVRGRRILAIGAGMNRDVIPFVDRGCEVVAVEPLADYVDSAPPGVSVQISYAEDLALDPSSTSPFDMVAFMHSTYGYTLSMDVRVATLARVRALLSAGGRVLVSVPVGPRRRTPIAAARLTARLSGADWLPEPGDILPDGTFGVVEHRFADGELEREVRMAGLSVVVSRVRSGMRLLELAPAVPDAKLG